MALSSGELVIDDRLATVLATPVSGSSGQRIQYRQLLDLLGRMPPDFVLPAPALDRLSDLARALPAAERSEILRSAPASLRHPGLILRLATQEPPVAAAAISAARLDDWQWSALIAELPLTARGHVRHRRDLGPRATAMLTRFGIGDLGLPSPEGAALENDSDILELGDFILPPSPPAPEPDDGPQIHDGIGAIVRRIEAFRRNRQAGTRQFAEATGARAAGESAADPRLPLLDSDRPDPERNDLAVPARAMHFASDARGRIVWADDGFAAAMVGLPFGANDPLAPARCDRASARAIRQRRPLRHGRVEIDGAPPVAGVWRVDAAPQFDRAGGRFTGYRGVLRRPSKADLGADPAADDPADRLRQLLHELRTPINAIQGFAELIQQQLFGPTPHQYRSLAAGIAGDSAAILAGFEEIDLLVRLETGQASEAGSGNEADSTTDLAALIERLIGLIAPSLAPRDVRFEFDAAGQAQVALAEGTAERLVWRLLATLAAATAPGEPIALELAASGEAVELWLALPAALAACDSAALFKVAAAHTGSPFAPGLLGGGFALRLARAEARAAGGALELDRSHARGGLRLRLPGIIPAKRKYPENPPIADLTPHADTNSAPDTATAFSVRSGR